MVDTQGRLDNHGHGIAAKTPCTGTEDGDKDGGSIEHTGAFTWRNDLRPALKEFAVAY